MTQSLLPVVCGVVPLCSSVASAAGAVVGSAVGGVASSVVGDVFGALVAGIDDAVNVALGGLASLLAPDPTVAAQWFRTDVAAMSDVAGLIEVPLLFLATIGAVIRSDTARLVRIWFVALPASVVFTVLAVPLVHLVMGATDEMAKFLTAKAGTPAQVQALVHVLAPPLVTLGGGVLAAVVGAGLLCATLVLSLELILRNAAIYLTVLFLPLVFAAAVWPPMVAAVKRALEVLATLILAKFVITATLVLGTSMLTAGAGVDTDLVGLAVLLLAAFAPVAVLRLMPLIEGAAIGHLEGRSRQPLQAARGGVHSARASVPAAGSVLSRLSDGGGGGGGGGSDVETGADSSDGAGSGGAGSGGAGSGGAGGTSGAIGAVARAGAAGAAVAQSGVATLEDVTAPDGGGPEGSDEPGLSGGTPGQGDVDDRFPWGQGLPPLADGVDDPYGDGWEGAAPAAPDDHVGAG